MPPWRIGIVGAEASKFTAKGEEEAKEIIQNVLHYATISDRITVVSGECPKGGVDIWAKELAAEYLCGFEPHEPAANNWPAYKIRNTLIARRSDEIHVITPDVLPSGASLFCYHCKTNEHVRNGGCWTAKCFERIKPNRTTMERAIWHVVSNE